MVVTIAHTNIPNSIVKYMRRLPVNRTKHMNITLTRLSSVLIIAAARSGAIGLSYALKICTINGRIEFVPVNWTKMNSDRTIINGLRIRLRFNSANFSRIVGNGCEHGKFNFAQDWHDFDCSLCRCKSPNSWLMWCRVVQPRSHCNDFSASVKRFFESNHCGVSGIWKAEN